MKRVVGLWGLVDNNLCSGILGVGMRRVRLYVVVIRILVGGDILDWVSVEVMRWM